MDVDVNEHESIQQYISSDTFVAILQFTVNVGYLTIVREHHFVRAMISMESRTVVVVIAW
jgi:ABC-type protease/lipase transport system fused ATPase/permease subunit